jgi:general transcription factor 3C polypeptide 3 (transcription factor C subunit 4)
VNATVPLAEALLARGGGDGGGDGDGARVAEAVLEVLPDEKRLLEIMTSAPSAPRRFSSSAAAPASGTAAMESPRIGLAGPDGWLSESDRIRARAGRALAWRRRAAGDAAFLREAAPFVASLRDGFAAEVSAARTRKRAAEAPRAAGKAGRVSKASRQSDGVFVGYQKRDRSKPKTVDVAPEDDSETDGREDDFRTSGRDDPLDSEGPPATSPRVSFELILSIAHASFLNGDLERAGSLCDDVLRFKSRDSGLGKTQTAGFLYLKAHVAFAAGDCRTAREASRAVCEKVPHSQEAWRLFREASSAIPGSSAMTVFLRACARSDREEKAREEKESLSRARARMDLPADLPTDLPRRATGATEPPSRAVPEAEKEGSKSRLPALLASGYANAHARRWDAAYRDFTRAFSVAPDEPLVALCAGVAGAHRATQSALSEREPNKHDAVLKSVAFFSRAARLREAASRVPRVDADPDANAVAGKQEGAYNLARGVHQLGLPHLAVPLYEKCLETGRAGGFRPETGSRAERGGDWNLNREAAHNLALIYKSSGADVLAREVLRKYSTV